MNWLIDWWASGTWNRHTPAAGLLLTGMPPQLYVNGALISALRPPQLVHRTLTTQSTVCATTHPSGLRTRGPMLAHG